MLNLDVRTGDALGFIDRLSKQAPFAISVGLNRVTELGMAAAGKGIKARMTVRVPRFTLPPLQIPSRYRATKDKLFVIADIGYDEEPGSLGQRRRQILAKFEEGGKKVATDRNYPIAIPTGAIRPTPEGLVPAKLYPRNLVGIFEKSPEATTRRRGFAGTFLGLGDTGRTKKTADRYFVFGKPGDRDWGLWERYGRRAREVRMLWAFRSQIPIPPLLHYQEDITTTVNANFERELRAAMDFAIETAK